MQSDSTLWIQLALGVSKLAVNIFSALGPLAVLS